MVRRARRACATVPGDIEDMGSFWGLRLGLTELPVGIAGDSSAPRRWTGAATGAREIVALGMLGPLVAILAGASAE